MNCRNCGAEIDENTAECPKCSASQIPESKFIDKGGFGWGLLGFIAPIVGIIMNLSWRNVRPKSTKDAVNGALIGISVFVLFYVLCFMLASIGGS